MPIVYNSTGVRLKSLTRCRNRSFAGGVNMVKEDLNRKVDLAFLSAFYGGMLTEKQRRILSLYCEEDLSLGEIAEEVGISRQAAHESLTRAAEKLSEMESALGVAERFRKIDSGLESALDALNCKDYPRAESLLKEMLTIETEESSDRSWR